METAAETAPAYLSQCLFQTRLKVTSPFHRPAPAAEQDSHAGWSRRGEEGGTGRLLLPEDSGLASVICVHGPASGAAINTSSLLL